MKILSRFLATVFLGTAAVAMVLRGEDVTGKVAVSDGLGDTQAAASADHNTIGRPDRGKEVRAPGAVENIPISTDLHTRAPATHDDDRLAEVYTSANYRGIVAWATQRDAEREYCIPVNYPKGSVIRSIRQHKDSEDTWFVCWYYDDDNCNSKFILVGMFNPFYLQRDESLYSIEKPISSMKCNYADPGGRKQEDGQVIAKRGDNA